MCPPWLCSWAFRGLGEWEDIGEDWANDLAVGQARQSRELGRVELREGECFPGPMGLGLLRRRR